MDTTTKISRIFKSIEKFRADNNNGEKFNDGIIFALDTMKIWFDKDELIKAGVDPRLQHEIDDENKKKFIKGI